MPVDRAKYVLGLTFEKNAPFKKLRVMLASEEMLQKILTDPAVEVSYEEDLHVERWEAMRLMAQIYGRDGTNNPGSCLWKVEIALPRIPAQTFPGAFPSAITPPQVIEGGMIRPAKD